MMIDKLVIGNLYQYTKKYIQEKDYPHHHPWWIGTNYNVLEPLKFESILLFLGQEKLYGAQLYCKFLFLKKICYTKSENKILIYFKEI